jgi:hypothetical protein
MAEKIQAESVPKARRDAEGDLCGRDADRQRLRDIRDHFFERTCIPESSPRCREAFSAHLLSFSILSSSWGIIYKQCVNAE